MRDSYKAMETCEINIRQNPQYACVSTLLDNTSNYLQPSPIIEIRQAIPTCDQLSMSVTLIDSKTGIELNSYRDCEGHPQPYLTGTVVSPTYNVRAGGREQVRVFLFPEVKVWVAGRFRLRFSLFESYRDTMQLYHVTLSSAFTVYPYGVYPGKFPPTPLDITLASQNVRQRIYKQPIIRRFKSPNTLPPIMPEAPEASVMGPLPQLHKIPAKGETRRRYAASTPASGILPVQTRQRLSRPPSKLRERSPGRKGEPHSLLVEVSSPSSYLPCDAKESGSLESTAGDGMVYSVKTSPSHASDQPRTSNENRAKPSDKMALRNLLR